MKFTKMHGIGNDYIYCYDMEGQDFQKLAKTLSPRHTGVGSDGIIHLYHDKEQGDFVMEMYNADGSQGAMCGNGIRCAGKFLYEEGYTQKKNLEIITAAGSRQISLHVTPENQVTQVTVAMGIPCDYTPYCLPIQGHTIKGTYVSMGNPHFVVMCPDPMEIPLEIWGRELETHEVFAPDGVNVEFYTPTEEGFFMRVWERGSGETLACGTGACACFAVGQKEGTLDQGATKARLLGGTLDLWEEEGEIMMKGEAVTVFHGEIPDV
ncbi:MAG: diaminopimelate epimerase [Eubacteriales bacterium]